MAERGDDRHESELPAGVYRHHAAAQASKFNVGEARGGDHVGEEIGGGKLADRFDEIAIRRPSPATTSPIVGMATKE